MADRSLSAAVAEIKLNPGKFYVYVMSRPDDTPFYVGVGSVHRRDSYHRIERHEIEARGASDTHKVRVIRSIWNASCVVQYRIDSFHDGKESVFSRECELIAELGRIGLRTGPLVNQTKGGSGLLDPSPDVLKRMREKIVLYWSKPGSRERHSLIKSAQCQKPELRKRLSAIQKIRVAADPGFSARQAEIARTAWRDPEYRAAHTAREAEKWRDPDRIRHQSEMANRQFSDPAVRAAAAERTRQQFADPIARSRAAETTRRKAAERRMLVSAVEAKIAESGLKMKLPSRRGAIRDWAKIAETLGLTIQ